MPSRRPLLSHLIAPLLSILLLAPGHTVLAGSEAVTSATLRAAKVANAVHGILGYTRWPQQPAIVRLCVVAPTEYADLLWQANALESSQPVEARRLLVDDPQLEHDCEAIYLGVLPEQQRQALYTRLVGKPILTISETAQECSDGSLFCLSIADEHVAFRVNLDSVARSGLRIHPNVLQLGRRSEAQP